MKIFRKFRVCVLCMLCCLCSVEVERVFSVEEDRGGLGAKNGSTVSLEELGKTLEAAHGLCIEVGNAPVLSHLIRSNGNLVVHCLSSNEQHVKHVERRATTAEASVVDEFWEAKTLPHASNLASIIVIHDPTLTNRSEALRVLSPGASVYIREGDGYVKETKRRPLGMDSWTHQWHDAGGGLNTDDQYVGVPTGVQWLSGPLFAMAGRKNSTQSLVSANGINVYVTQNVLENVGRLEMPQFLVARDAFNGLELWQRPWEGTFVTGNGETNPRLVAADDRLFIAGDSSIQAIDMRTGELLSEYPLEMPADKLAFAFDSLFVQTADGIVAVDKELASQRWDYRASQMSAMVIANGRILTLISGRSADGQFQHDLVALNPDSGEQLWQTNTQEQLTAAMVRINFAEDGFIALQAHGSLHLYSADNGEHLWSKETDARPGKTYVDERYVGHFYRHDLVWLLRENSPREPMGQNTWVGLDARTGKFVRELQTKGAWPETETPAKMGCQLLIASDRYIMIPRQATFIDFESGEKLPFKFTRGGCGLGFVPANGLVYSHPHACGCFSEAIRGFMGMHSEAAPPLAGVDDKRLRTGPAYDSTQLRADADSDWPTYRQGNDRGAYAKTQVLESSHLRWSRQIASTAQSPSLNGWKLRTGNLVSPATVSEGKAFVADIDRGIVRAFDIESGESSWAFAAAGRVDTPPTLYRGLCLFGSHDGYVYCLQALTGELVWKFRVAPIERRILAYASVESTWPVAGAVLVRDGIVFAAAGRAPDADGGMEVHALDVLTGRPAWTKRVSGAGFNGVCDFLVADKESLFLSNWEFDPKTGDNHATDSTAHLRGGKVGLLEASWTKHDLATRKEIQTWRIKDTGGQLLAFSPRAVVSYNAETKSLTCNGEHEWTIEVAAPSQLTSLAITDQQVVVAGGKDRTDVMAGGWMKVLDMKSGTEYFSTELPAESVFDGISLAQGRIFVSTQDGQLHCFDSEVPAK